MYLVIWLNDNFFFNMYFTFIFVKFDFTTNVIQENEKQCLEYMDRLKLLKNELNDIKNVYIEKQRESKSWDTKVQSLVEMKKEIKQKEGDSGDIDAMKNEIHRMQVKQQYNILEYFTTLFTSLK